MGLDFHWFCGCRPESSRDGLSRSSLNQGQEAGCSRLSLTRVLGLPMFWSLVLYQAEHPYSS